MKINTLITGAAMLMGLLYPQLIKAQEATDAETPVYYPESEFKNTTSDWWVNQSDTYVLEAGKKMEFKFYNYSDKAQWWNNWCLVAATTEYGAADYSEYFVLRNDNYGWFDALGGNTNENTSNVTFELNSNFDFTTFADDMDGSLVDMIVSLDNEGHFSMTSTITTTAQKVYNYSFSMLMTDKPSAITLFFVSQCSYIDGSSLVPSDPEPSDPEPSDPDDPTEIDPEATVYYPESEFKNTTSDWWVNQSDTYVLEAGKKMEFKFYNYSDKAQWWNNWCLVAATTEYGAADYSEYFVLRNDNYGWFDALGGNTNENTSNVTFELNSNFDFTTFADDMDGSLVDMIVSLDDEGHFSMTSTITTTEQKVYNYSFSMLMTDKPSAITLFFVSQCSYIDGSSLVPSEPDPDPSDPDNPTGITSVTAEGTAAQNAATYSLSGQRVEKNYKGIVVKNGKKYVNK